MTDAENGTLAGLISAEPLGSLLVLLTAVLLAGHYLGRSQQKNGGFWAWVHAAIYSVANAFAYVSLVVLMVSLLGTGIQAFKHEHGVYSQEGTAAWRAWQVATRQRGVILQPELAVRFFRTVAQVGQVPASDPDRPALFQTIYTRQEETQNSIESFTGTVELITSGLSGGASAQFNTFEASAVFYYRVANRLDHGVEAEFNFPLAAAPTFIKSIQVLVDGNDLSGHFAVVNRALTWSQALAAGQSVSVVVRCRAEGIDGYLYGLAESRELRDFSFTLLVDDPRYFVMTYPDVISFQFATAGLWNRNTWEVDQAIMAPTLGVFFVQGREYAPYDALLNVLGQAPHAVTILLVVAVLTLLLNREEFRLTEILLLAGVILVPFLLVTGFPALFPHFRVLLPLAVLASAALVFLIFYRHSRLTWILILVWTAILIGGYPFLGLIVNGVVKNTLDTVLLAVMIVYIFGLALSMRLMRGRARGGNPT